MAKTLHPTHRRRPYRGGEQASTLSMLDCSTAGAGGRHHLSPGIQVRVHRTYDPEKEMSNFSFEEIVAAARMVQLNRDWRTQIARA